MNLREEHRGRHRDIGALLRTGGSYRGATLKFLGRLPVQMKRTFMRTKFWRLPGEKIELQRRRPANRKRPVKFHLALLKWVEDIQLRGSFSHSAARI